MPEVSLRSWILAVLALCGALALTVGAQQARSAVAYKKCSLSEREQQPPGGKPTYNLSVKTRGASCTTAKKVARACQACRAKSAVVCGHKVLGSWRCTGAKDSSTPVLFYATVTCTSGGRRAKSTYQQNL
ncbi:MAG: hypothetical protein QOE11_585 [Solirubrobacteraceae bacterium]|nr:hypothetical protein [Solirubrobacteraceae bacterium]